jgi:outer membrane protein TolC
MVRLKSAQEQLLLQRNVTDLVIQNRDLAKKEYVAGKSSLLHLNEAQKELVRAQRELALSLLSLRLAWQELQMFTGEILVSK